MLNFHAPQENRANLATQANQANQKSHATQAIHRARFKQGFTLLEMAIVIVIIGLAMTMLIQTTRGLSDAENRKLVQKKLEVIDTAFANFVAANKRLPCPANGAIKSGAPNAGVESPFPATGTCNAASQVVGVIPWVTLGLTEVDAEDPWLGRITYRVDPELVKIAPRLMDMSNCDPSSVGGGLGASNSCKTPETPVVPCSGSSGCTSPTEFLANKGLDVWDGVNDAAGWAARQNNRGNGTGAAYVIISHGPTGYGAYNKNGTLQQGSLSIPIPPLPQPPPPSLIAGIDELPNSNNKVIALPSSQLTTYRTAPLNDVVSSAHFDDYLSHPTIMSVLNKANLGPRAH